MSWNYDRSLTRIQDHLKTMGEIQVSKLVREADLENLLSETCCREIYGAHVYVQVTNFASLASNGLYAADDYKRLIQGVHIYQREVSRIVEDEQIFDGVRIHFQGPKLHALFYRPIDDSKALATRAVLVQLVLKDFVRSVFNPAFPHYDDFAIAGGADLGMAIGTSNGLKGDRELLFLGAPANHAAKIISSSGRMRVTKPIYEALPKDLQALCSCVGEKVYRLAPVKGDELDGLLRRYKVGWRREASAKRIEEDKKRFPLKDIAYSSAEELIDLDSLSIYNNKRVLAASIFGDVSGFTRYIDAATTVEERKAALRVFHAIRKEMAYVVRQDFGGLRIQYQGDRVQGLFHLPEDKAAAIAAKAVEAAIGLQSSMEHTLKQCLPEASSLKLAVGVDQGITLVSKLGTRGQRDRICLGTAVECAAACEERSSGGQIGITKEIYTLLSATLQERFTYSQTAQCYVATDLTTDKLERAMRGAQNYRLSKPVFTSAGAGGITVSGQEVSGARPVSPKKPYAP